mmetsp:Transcript_16083/g.66264  ORF Transcript_16083/g.66264 Transcript_16083/m.66264 type:complete len:154 (+) Transcript_16083:1904-2365(+)
MRVHVRGAGETRSLIRFGKGVSIKRSVSGRGISLASSRKYSERPIGPLHFLKSGLLESVHDPSEQPSGLLRSRVPDVVIELPARLEGSAKLVVEVECVEFVAQRECWWVVYNRTEALIRNGGQEFNGITDFSVDFRVFEEPPRPRISTLYIYN